MANISESIIENRMELPSTLTHTFLANLPTFSGDRDEDIHQFFREFEDNLFGLGSDIKITGIHRALKGGAREFLGTCQEDIMDRNYAGLKSKITTRYSNVSTEQRLRAKLRAMNFNSRGQETMVAYYDRFCGLARQIGRDSSEEDIVNDFFLSLSPDVQSQLVRLTDIKLLKTKDQLYNLVHRFDQSYHPENLESELLNDIKRYIDNHIRRSDTIETEDNKVEQIAALGGRKDIGEITCYNCKAKGHYATKCPEKKKKTTKDWSSENKALREKYEAQYGKPEAECPICEGYHFVAHCPLKQLKGEGSQES